MRLADPPESLLRFVNWKALKFVKILCALGVDNMISRGLMNRHTYSLERTLNKFQARYGANDEVVRALAIELEKRHSAELQAAKQRQSADIQVHEAHTYGEVHH